MSEAISKKMESQMKGAHPFVLDKQSASGSGPLEEGHPRSRLAWIDGYRVGSTVKVAATDVAPIHVCMSRVGMAAEYNQADSQPQRFQLAAAHLVKHTRKRAGIMTGIGLGTEVDAVVSSEYGVDRQKNREERKRHEDWTSSVAFHASLASGANNFAIAARAAIQARTNHEQMQGHL
jgi:hypothetical protein